MWFAALGETWEQPWFVTFLRRLLEGSPRVHSLLAVNPFPDHPPKYVRALLYDYRFADPITHAATGQWWVPAAGKAALPGEISLSGFEADGTGRSVADEPPRSACRFCCRTARRLPRRRGGVP